jgi:hypothetical protein
VAKVQQTVIGPETTAVIEEESSSSSSSVVYCNRLAQNNE